ncbi:MAG: N-acetylmuramic acid 6-phosphate etherase [Balneolaceae bacterium]
MSKESKDLFDKLNHLATEQRNLDTLGIDVAPPLEIVRLINEADKKVAELVELKLPAIAEAVEAISQSFTKGGRLFYFGAGTSGRLGVLDASECPPTFGSNPEQVQAFIAGGAAAMFVAQEGVEDSVEEGVKDVSKVDAEAIDVVCGLAASGRTPYVIGALKEAKRRGCVTIMVTTVPAEQLDYHADIVIDVPVGPEVIMGSTRMKSGTAQKMVLNMLTTGAMVRQGKVFENVMVDLHLTNKKLVERAKRIIMLFTKADYERATYLLNEADNHVKTALVMELANTDKKEAQELLKRNQGFIRKAIKELEG